MKKRFFIEEKGVLTLEACVTVTLFTLFILFMSSFLIFFMAQNEISHALVATSESLSLDKPYNDMVEYDITDSDKNSVQTVLSTAFSRIYSSALSSDDRFYSNETWYSESGTEPFKEEIKKRFSGMISGKDGTKEDADSYLKSLRVVNGLEGIDFGGSKIENGDLYITIKYKLRFLVSINNFGEVEAEQTVRAKMWG